MSIEISYEHPEKLRFAFVQQDDAIHDRIC